MVDVWGDTPNSTVTFWLIPALVAFFSVPPL